MEALQNMCVCVEQNLQTMDLSIKKNVAQKMLYDCYIQKLYFLQ